MALIIGVIANARLVLHDGISQRHLGTQALEGTDFDTRLGIKRRIDTAVHQQGVVIAVVGVMRGHTVAQQLATQCVGINRKAIDQRKVETHIGREAEGCTVAEANIL